MVRHWRIALVAAIAIGLTACGASNSPKQGPIVVRGDGSVELPSETLTDWVSYADIVVVVHVDSETAQPESDDVKRTGEGLVGRKVNVSVTDTLWTRDPKFVAPTTTTLDAWGWVVKDGKRQPTVPRNSSRIEVGHTYILALTSSGHRPGWTSLGPGAEIPFDHGIAGTGERLGADPGHTDSAESTHQQLSGRSRDSVEALLANTKPDPLAVTYGSLPAPERYQRVTAER